MSIIPIGEKDEEDMDSKTRQMDDTRSVMNSVKLLKSFKDVKVQNVCGSTAGAGSGTFHKYRQCKRREQFRLEQMKKEHRISQINERIKKRKRENDAILEQKRSKKRKLRHKKKQRRHRAKLQETKQNEEVNKNGNNKNDKNDKDDKDDNIINKNHLDEDEQLDELLNIDKSLSTKKRNVYNDNDENEDDDLHQHTKLNKTSNNNDIKNNDIDNEDSIKEKKSILAALAAEFDE